MYFFGKIIGVFLGFKWGGFFGAIAGLILGSIADKKLYELGSVNSSFFKKKTTRQALFMQTTFAVLGHLSKSKGRVTEEDIQLANQLMNQMQLDESHRKLAQEAFRRGKEADFPLRQVIREFRIGCGQRADLLRMFLHVQVQAAFADSQLHESEKEVLYVVAEELGLSRMQFEQMLAMESAAKSTPPPGAEQQRAFSAAVVTSCSRWSAPKPQSRPSPHCRTDWARPTSRACNHSHTPLQSPL